MADPSPSRYLASTTLFGCASPAALQMLDRDARWMHVAGGHPLHHQGERPEALYIVARGTLHVIQEAGSGDVRLAGTLGRGSVVNAEAVVLNQTCGETVVACRDAQLLRIDRGDVERMLDRHPSVLLDMARLLGAHHGQPTRGPRLPRTRTIVLLPTGDPTAAVSWAEALTAALSPTPHDAIHVTPALVASMVPDAADADRNAVVALRLLRWMTELEDRFRYVVYQTDVSQPAWTRRCLRQADVVLLTARAASADTSRGELEIAAAQQNGGRTPIELVLTHDSDSPAPGSAARWLEGQHRPLDGAVRGDTASPAVGRRVARHHHLRAGRREDVERLARALTGRTLGVVLGGGGGMRGFAHVGVLAALRDHGLAVDAVGGTGTGALMAALCAAGCEPSEVVARVRAALGPGERRLFGRSSARDASRAAALMTAPAMKNLFGEALLDDLVIPCFLVSTNLTRGMPVVHDRGPAWKFVCASSAIPGLASPVSHDGELLVDGAVLEHLPIGAMRERQHGLVIGVDVAAVSDPETVAAADAEGSWWKLLGRRTRPRRAPAPDPADPEIVTRAAALCSARLAGRAQAQCDLYVRPDVARFGMYSLNGLDAVIEAGYRAADEYLEGWKARVAAAGD